MIAHHLYSQQLFPANVIYLKGQTQKLMSSPDNTQGDLNQSKTNLMGHPMRKMLHLRWTVAMPITGALHSTWGS